MEQPSAAAFQAMLEAAQAKAEGETEKTQFTAEEAEKFKKAFDDPEFRRMFSEYVEEMSDPKNREETEMYISQLEGEQKVPQGKELIRPVPSFVAKTHKIDTSKKPEARGDKIWLNIVQSDKIAEPTKAVTPEGESWSLPYSLGPPHMERDQKDANVAAFDCCFHPTAITLATERKKFRDLLVQTAIEGVEESFRRQKQDTKVSKEFHVLKGVSYKSGQVPAMLVDISSKKHWNEGGGGGGGGGGEGVVKNEETSANLAAKQEEPMSKVTAAPTRDPAIKKGFLNAAAPPSSKAARSSALPSPPQPSSMIQELPPSALSASPIAPKTISVVDSVSGGPVAPVYSLKERGSVSWGDFEQMRNSTSKPPTSTRPAELICRIEIPKVTAMTDMILDVSERRLQLSYRQDYLLSIALPYPVLDKKGVAKYDKTSKSLNVTLPVQLPVAPVVDAVSVELPSHKGEKEEDAHSATHEEKRTSPKKTPLESSHKRWVSSMDEEETKQALKLKEEIKLQAEKARMEQQSASPSPGPGLVPRQANGDLTAPVTAGSVKEEQGCPPDFAPSVEFAGKRPGYVFKRGDKGVGYYIDSPRFAVAPASPQHQQQQQQGAAEPIHFLFEARQTLGAVAVLVQVPAIDPATLTISFHKNLVQVKFSSSAGGSEGKKVWYAQDLVPLADLNAETCRFDVVQRNMVLVLTKQDEVHWNNDGVELVSSKPYSGSAVTAAAAEAAATPPVTVVAAASPSLPSLQESVEAMSFAQKSAVLFELD